MIFLRGGGPLRNFLAKPATELQNLEQGRMAMPSALERESPHARAGLT